MDACLSHKVLKESTHTNLQELKRRRSAPIYGKGIVPYPPIYPNRLSASGPPEKLEPFKKTKDRARICLLGSVPWPKPTRPWLEPLSPPARCPPSDSAGSRNGSAAWRNGRKAPGPPTRGRRRCVCVRVCVCVFLFSGGCNY